VRSSSNDDWGHDSCLAALARDGGARSGSGPRSAPQTAFDRDIARFTWLLLRFMIVMVPLVFAINVVTKGNWSQAFFFAMAVAVGLTPEMLPMIVTVCLSEGAVAMGKKKVIVKRLDAIQNLGAMDVLCTDKTGTLTMDQVVLEKYCDVALRTSEAVLSLAYTNSHFQTGLRNVLDRAVLAHEDVHASARIADITKIDEIPFDFQRRIMSVVVRTHGGKDLIVSKGAPEAIFPRCTSFELDGKCQPLDQAHIETLKHEYERLSADGFRVLAIATKETSPRETVAGATPYTNKALTRFILFIGPCSSVFDYTTYFVMLYLFGCWDVSSASAAAHSASLFQTGWFVESLLTQTLVIHIIRTNKIPFVQSRASGAVIGMSVVLIALGIALPVSPIGPYLGFTSLPWLYWPILIVTIASYLLLTQAVKMWLLRRRWI
jgi:magnesium-transporting ATPase (P-type)